MNQQQQQSQSLLRSALSIPQQKLIPFDGSGINQLFSILQSQIQQSPNTQFLILKQVFSRMYRYNFGPRVQVRECYPNQLIRNVFKSTHFINLLQLFINNMKLDNIQFIGFMNAPVLKLLNLYKNNITNFKPLDKITFQNFKQITLNDNKISSNLLQRSKIAGSGILILQQRLDQPILMQDLSKLVKIQLNNIFQLFIRAQKRIHQQKLLKKIKERFQPKDPLRKNADLFFKLLNIGQQELQKYRKSIIVNS